MRAAQVAGAELLWLRVAAKLTRLWHWEYWPSWVVYAPLVPWWVWLAIRYRGVTVFTAANPGIPLGGLVGESKYDILSQLPAESIVATARIGARTLSERRDAVVEAIQRRGWAYPVILKPDVGERGAGVRLVREDAEIDGYLREHPGVVVAQEFHPGPLEVGVFYVREPRAANGRIFSITDKRFASVVGDGVSTLRAMIWRHPRYRAQAGVFLERLGNRADGVPAAGEKVSLGTAGNHCQGTMFLDGERLITPKLTAAFVRIASCFPGFGFGRFDVRYSSDADLMAGVGFKIVELNGVLSESTNIYDPSMGFWAGQRVLREQWRLAWAIGAANRAAMGPLPSLWTVLRALVAHAWRADIDHGAD